MFLNKKSELDNLIPCIKYTLTLSAQHKTAADATETRIIARQSKTNH